MTDHEILRAVKILMGLPKDLSVQMMVICSYCGRTHDRPPSGENHTGMGWMVTEDPTANTIEDNLRRILDQEQALGAWADLHRPQGPERTMPC